MYFKKINFTVPNIDYEPYIDSHLVSYGKNKLLSYYRLKHEAKKPIIDSLPAELIDNVEILYCHSGQIEPDVIPHIDNGISVSINCYLDTADAHTIFFEKKKNVEGMPTTGIDSAEISHKNGLIFNIEELDFICAFKAYPGDSYILDVSKIHAVKGLNLPSVRKFICIQTSRFSFQDFSSMFQ